MESQEPISPNPRAGRYWIYAASVGMALFLFVCDLLIPRGATPAIGYCAVPVLAAGARRHRFLLGITAICSLFTALGLYFEPLGGALWMSAFDRTLIVAVLWLAYRLAWRRCQSIDSLARQTRVLEQTKLELQRSNAELDSFASVVAHDLRGPLNTNGLLSQRMGDQRLRGTPEESAEWAMDIQSEVASLGDLIQSLLTYGRVGGGEVHLTQCDCDAVLDRVKHRLKSELEQNGAELTHAPLPTVHADPALLGELFQNLIENGIRHHGDRPPRIHVHAIQRGGVSQFFVTDNGVGIRAADFQRIFQAFRQGGGGAGRGGVGLGLATCKRIVERHGGEIGVESRLGEGAVFSFTIPLHPPRASSGETPPAPSTARSVPHPD
jgi:signal transduction histidine kinase